MPLQESSITAMDQFFLCLKDIGPFVERWMDLKSVIQSEDREKQTPYTNMYIMKLFTGKEWRHRWKAWTCGLSGEGGGGGQIESVVLTYTHHHM